MQVELSRDKTPPMDINKRAEVSLALHRYVRAAERFEDASKEFNEACHGLRDSLPRGSYFIANINYQHYVVMCNDEGNFSVDGIESI